MAQQAREIDRDYILGRISNWKERLNQLFSEIEKWTEGFEKMEITRSNIPLKLEKKTRKRGQANYAYSSMRKAD